MTSPFQLDWNTSGHQPYQADGFDKAGDDLLQTCWRQQGCWDCLRQEPCSWCPSTSTCIPNTYKVQILAPIFNPNVCPLWSERWEVRARPLGCHVSTITLLTCIISVVSTLTATGLIVVSLKAARWLIPRWKARRKGWWRVWKHYPPGWWKGRRLGLSDRTASEPRESSPLLA